MPLRRVSVGEHGAGTSRARPESGEAGPVGWPAAARDQGDVCQPRVPVRGMRGGSKRREPQAATLSPSGLRLPTVSRSDEHWLGRVVLTIGVAMSATTVVLLLVLLIGGR